MSDTIFNMLEMYSLSDCFIEKIEYTDDKIVMKFDKNGYWKKEDDKSGYSRVSEAEVHLFNVNFKNLYVKQIYIKYLFGKEFHYCKEWKWSDFVQIINSGKCKFEIVYSYDNMVSELYLGKLRYKERHKEVYNWVLLPIEREEKVYKHI